MRDLFLGTGTAHTILLMSLVVATGLYLGRFKFKGISIGPTWILFIGIILSHFGLRGDPAILSFMKDFGLILFIFSIGMQVGPGFFHSFKTGGVLLNLLAVLMIALSVAVVYGIQAVTGEDIRILTGVLAGAAPNTPALGAAQHTLTDLGLPGAEETASQMASAYAVAYPFGVLGVILILILFKSMFKIDIKKEQEELDSESGGGEKTVFCTFIVKNPALFGKQIGELSETHNGKFVISRLLRNGEVLLPGSDTVLEEGDRLLVTTVEDHEAGVKMLFGEEIRMPFKEWDKVTSRMVARSLTISKGSITGHSLKDLNVRNKYGVSVTRVIRAGVGLVAQPSLVLQMGDTLKVVGTREAIEKVAELFGNKAEKLNSPNIVPFFFGVALGVLVGSIPIAFPGLPQPVKLGLAGGPLIVAILLAYFGPKMGINTYTAPSANLMLKEIGLSFFLAAVGLSAGETFVSAFVNGGYWWFIYGAAITLIPALITGIIARCCFKVNFYKLAGMLIGSTTNAPVLGFAQEAYGTDYTSVSYATVYPISMFLRVIIAQLMILFTL